MQIGAELLGNALAAGEERAPRPGANKDLVDYRPVAVHIVGIRCWHAHVVQHAQERLCNYAHPADTPVEK